MPRFSRRRSFRRGPKRAMEWIGAHASPTGNPGELGLVAIAPPGGGGTAGINDWILSPAEAQEFFDEPTLVRTLIDVLVALPAPGASPVDLAGWMGMLILPGDGASPDPSIQAGDASKDWLWWQPFILGTTVPASTVYISGQSAFMSGKFDIRSKRKILGGDGVGFYLSWSPIADNVDLNLGFQCRLLLQNR